MDEVVIYLLANGERTGARAVLNEANAWQHTFIDLPEYLDGNPIQYGIEEVAIEGYEVRYSGTAEEGYVVTNTYVPPISNILARKVWEHGPETKPTIWF